MGIKTCLEVRIIKDGDFSTIFTLHHPKRLDEISIVTSLNTSECSCKKINFKFYISCLYIYIYMILNKKHFSYFNIFYEKLFKLFQCT